MGLFPVENRTVSKKSRGDLKGSPSRCCCCMTYGMCSAHHSFGWLEAPPPLVINPPAHPPIKPGSHSLAETGSYLNGPGRATVGVPDSNWRRVFSAPNVQAQGLQMEPHELFSKLNDLIT